MILYWKKLITFPFLQKLCTHKKRLGLPDQFVFVRVLFLFQNTSEKWIIFIELITEFTNTHPINAIPLLLCLLGHELFIAVVLKAKKHE